MTETPSRGPRPLPTRPYLRTLLVNLALAAVLFAFAWILGSGPVDSTIYATFYFVGATAWTFARLWRRRAKEGAAE